MVQAGLTFFLLQIVLSILIVRGEETSATCRYGPGFEYEPSIFKPLACCNCFNGMFRTPGNVEVVTAECNNTSLRIEPIKGKKKYSIEPLLSNSKEICDVIGIDNWCQYWVDCCEDAIDCCDDMVAEQTGDSSLTQSSIVQDNTELSAPDCPTTWDMFKCWKKTEPLTSPQSECPEFLVDKFTRCVDPEKHFVERRCLASGTWNDSLSLYLTESNYMRCTGDDLLECYEGWIYAKHTIALVCALLSLCAVIPAIIIFFSLRLYNQMRIKIHINLFIALALYDTLHLVYELTIRHPDKVTNSITENSIECRVVVALSKFLTLTMFTWMLMEGFFLNWLMMRTFREPKFWAICVAGWGIPMFIACLYAVVKANNPSSNVGCWMLGDNIDWIVNVPLILCVAINLVFLVNILRVILTKMNSRKEQPDYYPRLLKAMAILIPPFGLLLLFTLYGPDSLKFYEERLIVNCIAAGILHLQGFLVAIVLCYSNTEVLTQLHKSLSRRFACLQFTRKQVPENSVMTGVSHLSTGRTSISTGAESSTTPTQETHLLAKLQLANGESNNNSDSLER